MKKKIIKVFARFFTFLFLMCCVFIGLKYSIYKDGNLQYYKQINKTEKQIFYSNITDIGVSVLQYSPIIVGFISNNPAIYANYILSTVISLPICQILKIIVKEQRPDDANNYKSFPSGHTTLAFVGAFVLIISLRKKKNKYLFGTASIILAICVAYGRILAKRHWCVDVICGSILGSCSVFMSAFIISKIKKNYIFNKLKTENKMANYNFSKML